MLMLIFELQHLYYASCMTVENTSRAAAARSVCRCDGGWLAEFIVTEITLDTDTEYGFGGHSAAALLYMTVRHWDGGVDRC